MQDRHFGTSSHVGSHSCPRLMQQLYMKQLSAVLQVKDRISCRAATNPTCPPLSVLCNAGHILTHSRRVVQEESCDRCSCSFLLLLLSGCVGTLIDALFDADRGHGHKLVRGHRITPCVQLVLVTREKGETCEKERFWTIPHECVTDASTQCR